MKKGIRQTSVYYVFITLVFLIVNYGFNQPKHGLNLSLLFLFGIAVILFVAVFYHSLVILLGKHKSWNEGAPVVHITVILLFLISLQGAV
ncbi:hypothetical protein N7U66_02105 [Lacinutrix neustonica]|uniref:Uncharacterized protein n=1 Tax=Lacinutrix neustonica TaxID=2980107 RepID=A0A9E8MW07_9FLAO|nr:hypothetical protein [Lacinutrix neustonica]WAC02528.1 hypothetical protein N7U66_02105 [Lacinutrix neustonica]